MVSREKLTENQGVTQPPQSIRLLDEKEVHARTGMSLAWLRNKRAPDQKKLQTPGKPFEPGIPFVKIGRSVRYREEDVAAYINSRLRETT